jgi:16S rRNA (uracil1498-N3)-methyltransferase
MADRYFVDDPITADSAVLAGPEAHHLIHVMRAKPGTEVVLFDASGCEFAARVERIGRANATLAVLARHKVDRELPIRLTLGVCLPKGDRQRWLVEKGVELGVARLVPLVARRGVAQPSAEPPERLRRAVIEASKQCGRNRLMEIAPGEPLSDFLRSADSAASGNTIRWLAHPGGSPLGGALGDLPTLDRGRQIALAVGPEGGFTDDEVAAARTAGWQVIDLGARILRIETAACMLVSNVAARFA